MKVVFLCLLLAVTLLEIHGGPVKKTTINDIPNKNDEYFRGEQDHLDQRNIEEKDLPKNDEIFEGDIIMDDDIRRAVIGAEGDKRSVEVAAELHGRKHWVDGIVPFVLDKSLKRIVRRRIYQAIRRFNKYTCVRFIPKRVRDKDYVRFKDGRGCSSNVGRRGGEQPIHLGYYCKRIGTVMHEMMHALGIIHEQSRSDRDKFIKVKFENIKKKNVFNFRKYNYLKSANMDIPYNYWSIMQYSNRAFSRNGRKTLIAKVDPGLRFGQREQISHLDVQEINTLYNCLPNHADVSKLHADMTPEQAERRRRDQADRK